MQICCANKFGFYFQKINTVCIAYPSVKIITSQSEITKVRSMCFVAL